MHAPDLCMMRVNNDRGRESDLGFRIRGCIDEWSKIRNWVVRRIKTIGRDPAKIGDRRLGARISLPLGDPQRRIIAASIERVDTCPFLDTADDLVEFSAGKIV